MTNTYKRQGIIANLMKGLPFLEAASQNFCFLEKE